MAKEFKKKLADLRSVVGGIVKNSTNPFYKSEYFDINELLDQLQPELEERGLLLTQPIIDNAVYTIIEDIDSEERKESSLQLPDEHDPQKLGSAITYFRRYTAQSLLALRAVDDDGNQASGKSTQKKSKPKSKPKKKEEPKDTSPKVESDDEVIEKINSFEDDGELVDWFNNQMESIDGKEKEEYRETYLPVLKDRMAEIG